jgi:acetyl-CoA carboxylase carboxyl transferase subunit alpha
MKKIGLVDEIIKEPLGGAHTFPEKNFKIVKAAIIKSIKELININKDELVKNRMEKFSNMGIVNE